MHTEIPVQNAYITFLVSAQGLKIVISGTYDAPASVKNSGLGVKDGPLVIVDLSPGLQQAFVIIASCIIDRHDITLAGQQQL